MPSPKNGTLCILKEPEAPVAADDADVADPGKDVMKKEDKSSGNKGKSDTDDKKTPKEEKSHWIGIKLEDHEGKSAAGARYKVTLSDGTVQSGSLNKDGKVELKPIPAGQCKISFPDIHGDEWALKS